MRFGNSQGHRAPLTDFFLIPCVRLRACGGYDQIRWNLHRRGTTMRYRIRTNGVSVCLFLLDEPFGFFFLFPAQRYG